MERQMIIWIAIVGVILIVFLIRVVVVLRTLNKEHHFIEIGSEKDMFGIGVLDNYDDDEL